MKWKRKGRKDEFKDIMQGRKKGDRERRRKRERGRRGTLRGG